MVIKNTYLFFLVSWLCYGTLSAQATKNEHNVADEYFEKAKSFKTAQKPAKASLFFEKAANLYLSNDNWDKWFRCVFEVSENLKRKNELIQSIDYLTEKLTIGERILPKNHLVTAQLATYLGIAYNQLNIGTAAAIQYEKALKIFEKNKQQDRFVAIVYKNLGNIYARQNNFEQAVYLLNKALRIQERLRLYDKMTQTCRDIAMLYQRVENKTMATKYYNFALKQPRVGKVTKGLLEINLARIYLANEKITKAERNVQAVIEKWKNADPVPLAPLGLAYNFLGNIQEQTGNYIDALSTYQTALEINLQAFGKQHREISYTYNNIGNVYLALNEVDAALQSYQQSLIAISTKFRENDINIQPTTQQFHQDAWTVASLANKGKAWVRKYKQTPNNDTKLLLNALTCYELALQQGQQLLFQYDATVARNFLHDKLYAVYDQLLSSYGELWELTKGTKYLSRIFSLIEQSKIDLVQVTTQTLSTQKLFPIPTEVWLAEKKWQKQLTNVAHLLYYEQDSSYVETLTDSLAGIQEAYTAFNYRLKQNYPNYYNLTHAWQSTELIALQEELQGKEVEGKSEKAQQKADKAILTYFVGKENIYGLAITATNTTFHTHKLNSNFQASVDSLYQTISTLEFQDNPRQTFTQYTDLAYRFYQNLVAPLTKDLPKEIDLLQIIPDHQLRYIPFEALLTTLPDDKTTPNYQTNNLGYLIKKYRISYSYTATALPQHMAAREPIKHKMKNWIAFTPIPTYPPDSLLAKGCSDTLLYDLPCHIETLRAIKKQQKGKVYSQYKATKREFIEELGNHKILHLNAFTCLDDVQPLGNAFYLSDDHIKLSELYANRLQGELAIIDGIRINQEKWKRGESLMALTHSFNYAGYPAILTSLWPMRECSSGRLLQKFYKNASKTGEQTAALQQAKLNYLTTNIDSTALQHPFYWANWVHITNATAEPNFPIAKSYAWLWILSLLLLGIGYSMYFFRDKWLA